MPDAILRTVVCQVTLALHYSHTPTSSKGVVLHRDVKPENGAKVSLEIVSRSINANDSRQFSSQQEAILNLRTSGSPNSWDTLPPWHAPMLG